MTTSFPTSIDSLPRPSSTTKMNDSGYEGDVVVDNISDAIEALETKVGVDGSAVTTSHDYKLSGVTGTDKAASLTGTETFTNKTHTSPKINENVALTATSTELNILDGITASTAELNILDGVTASATDINNTVAASHTRSHTMTSASDHTAGNHKTFYSDGTGAIQELAHGTAGKVLQSNGASSAPTWETVASGATTVDSLTDATITSVADNEVLAYNSGTSEWINQTPDEADIIDKTTSQTLTNKTLTSPTINTPTLVLANTSPTADGSIGFDRTGEDLQIGDGTNSQVVHMGAWTSFTPSISGLTIGSGTRTGYYTVIGKTVIGRVDVTLAADSSVTGQFVLTLPVAIATYAQFDPIGQAFFFDASVTTGFFGSVTKEGNCYTFNVASTYPSYAVPSSTVPFTWTTNDRLHIQFTYESA